jgi:PAS domain S-box-containing protein
MIADIIENPKPYSGNENENMRRDGQRVWLIWTNKAILDDAGHISEVLCIGNDITERRQVEEALRVSQERFALAVRGSNDGIWDWDIQNKSLYWSPRLKELLGYADDELEIDFEIFASLLHPDDSQHVGAAIEAHFEQRAAYDVEERLRTKSGEYRWFRARGQAIWDEAGQPVRMVGSTTDITERKLAEAERERLLTVLENRSKQLQTAAEVSHAASSILDVDELIQQVVDLVQKRFDLYYAGLFLVDETGERSGEAGKWAVLRAGTGEAGRHMRQAGHKLEVGGQSMIGWCIANQQARIALDVGEEAVRFENPWLPETRSEMALPMIARGQAIGAMTIQSTQEAAFSAEDIAVLQTMGDQVANAIENARLFEAGRSALAEVEATHRVYLQREWREYLDRRDDFVCEGGQAGAMTRHQPAASAGNAGHGGQAELTVPIVLRGQTIGVLGLEDPQGTRQWSVEDQALVEAVSRQLALALENARLLEETQRRAARERLAREITDKMRHAPTMDALIQTTVREMAAALGAPNAFLQLSTPPESDR